MEPTNFSHPIGLTRENFISTDEDFSFLLVRNSFLPVRTSFLLIRTSRFYYSAMIHKRAEQQKSYINFLKKSPLASKLNRVVIDRADFSEFFRNITGKSTRGGSQKMEMALENSQK